MTVIVAMNSPVLNKVILVDDDEERRASLQTILSFIKVQHTVISFVELLQSKVHLEHYSIALIGQCNLPISLNKLIHFFSDSYENTPLCLLESWNDTEKLTEKSKKLLLRVLNRDMDDELLTDLLHEAQIYRSVRVVSKDHLQVEFPLIIGQSPAIIELKQVMSKVVNRDVNIYISGESGTGKELVARSLHNLSSRARQPFVPVNCGAIPAELLESELFGHEKGAFTGAVSSRAGRFEMADGGTLFLDEIGDMPLPMQVKMLRVLQERCFERVGGTKTIKVDVRIVTATHRNLEKMVQSGSFREDLFYRLNVYPIEVPALRDRKSDIQVLLQAFTERAAEQGLGRLKFQRSAIDSLELHPWDGNVRELLNLIERLAIMYPDGVVGVSELPIKCRHVDEPDPSRYQVQSDMNLESDRHFVSVLEEAAQTEQAALFVLPDRGLDLKQQIEDLETTLIHQALDKSNQVVARAATLLSIRRTTLVEKMRKYGIVRK
ncbi:MAG: sigma-54-dependent Fis family transcriptional regulator [Pseudomonadales bacterium]|nr:sigma-54-dependent Fis family transcriptional regulator [Pseudomonadales bacterium]NRA18030.1 sigma-54-dependent Fis family transcriptional regulator [Oceanospirillaceae bacterium]